MQKPETTPAKGSLVPGIVNPPQSDIPAQAQPEVDLVIYTASGWIKILIFSFSLMLHLSDFAYIDLGQRICQQKFMLLCVYFALHL